MERKAPEPIWRMDLTFPFTPRPRQGWGAPAHAELAALCAAARSRVEAWLTEIAAVRGEASDAIPVRERDNATPYWSNGWLPPLDALMLMAVLKTKRPKRLIEIGSGHSTRFARWAVGHWDTGTHITSIDPQPRADIDGLCDALVRAGLEDADLALFEDVAAGDVVSLDGSHRSMKNSDVTVFFLEVLPRLPKGVLVHIHDVFLPDDYPPEWNRRWYNEQYLLATALLFGSTLTVEMPVHWAARTFAPALPHDGDAFPGTGFWLSTRPVGERCI
ncbi:MAG: class I SAM-dependent methyltransferase [Alphaproteobacteria bacterium]|nr:class I SAM-dependent methyltransferase [Alphaproteobacteria bacterium]